MHEGRVDYVGKKLTVEKRVREIQGGRLFGVDGMVAGRKHVAHGEAGGNGLVCWGIVVGDGGRNGDGFGRVGDGALMHVPRRRRRSGLNDTEDER